MPISDGRFPRGEVITVVNRAASTTRDAAGNRLPGEDVRTEYIGAFDPAFGFESQNATEGRRTTQPAVFLPYCAVVTSKSQVIARGQTYQVDGDPLYWRNPITGEEPGCQVPLRRSSG